MLQQSEQDQTQLTPLEFRIQCREGKYNGQTSGRCKGYVQANLVILPSKYAEDFKKFCELNPKPCPLLEMGQKGSYDLPYLCPSGIDLRKDIPKYKIFEHGEFVKEVDDITEFWNDDLVSFLLGCSFSFEEALEQAGLPGRNVVEKRNVPMFKTNIKCESAGVFKGNMVVSMRPYKEHQIQEVSRITDQFPRVHGGPVFAGKDFKEKLGIEDIMKPDYGQSVTIEEDDVPVFWACGVTPQNVITQAKEIPIVITHAPGCMLITDILNDSLREIKKE